jgi:hypothetical protein
VELLPTPLLVELSGVRKEATPAGVEERGGATLRQISPRYTEDDIYALFHTQPLPTDRDGFLEIRIDARDGVTTRRRFAVKGVPFRDADKFEWRARLTKVDSDRTRAGAVTDDIESPAGVAFHRIGES